MKVSIITITYNNKKGLLKTLESVLAQTFHDYEYIVIDGGSTDGSRDVLEVYSDRLSYWVSEPDGGVYAAMNKGIVRAQGEYLHFLNSGDCYADPSVLDRVFSQNYTESLIRTIQICDYGEYQTKWVNFGEKDITLYDLYTNTMLHQATFIHNSLFKKYGSYDESLKIVSDWKFFLKAILGGEKTVFVNIASVIFEMYGISTNQSTGDLHLAERKNVLKALMPPNTIQDYERLKHLEFDSYMSEVIRSNKVNLFIFQVMNRLTKFFRRRK